MKYIRESKTLILIYLFILYEEIIFNCFTISNYEHIFLRLILCLFHTLIIVIISSLFKKKCSLVLKIILSFITLIFVINLVYYKLFGSVLSFYSIIFGSRALQYSGTILQTILNNWYVLLLIIGPFIYLCFQKFSKINLKNTFYGIIVNVLIIIVIIYFSGNGVYSAKNLIFNDYNSIQSLKTFGLISTLQIDLYNFVFNNTNSSNIEFNNQNDNVSEINDYIRNKKVTGKNEYTGLLSDQNLILVLAESFSPYAISEDLTPTLYKMSKEGYYFDNFYTPLFPTGTADGEYMFETSLLPVSGIWSIEEAINNYYPYTYPNIFKKYGYKTYAYHDYDYKYYKRDQYLDTYDSFKACGNGLEKVIDCDNIPSDYDMIKNTINDYVNEDKFLTYYITMSGHVDYSLNHSIVKKNYDLVKDLKYSNKVKYYLATQIELDKAMDELINQLKVHNKLDDTTIVIVSDHYPYGIGVEGINELSNKSNDKVFDVSKGALMIYSSKLKHKNVSKISSSIDVLPTILNLYGFQFDSRLLMGNDIFSNSESLVIFPNNSFISSDGEYNAITENVTNFEGKKLSDNSIKKLQNEVYDKFKYSRMILESDYYKTLKVP